MNVLRVYGDRKMFLSKMNPDVQLVAARDPKRAFFGESPSLVILNKTYGDGFAASWLMPQIYDMVVYCNSKSTLSDQQAEFLAEAIANEYYFLKTSELLLFFYRFKLGRYGQFYGVVDPMRVTMALDEFLKERNIELARHESEMQKAEEERRRRENPPVTPQEYCRNNGYPEFDNVLDVINYEMAQEAKRAESKSDQK